MSTEVYVLLSVVEAVLLVVVLALALIRISQRLNEIADGLRALGSALGGVEEDLALIGVVAPEMNGPLSEIVDALPGIAEKAEIVARG